jgi:hypothetical protein
VSGHARKRRGSEDARSQPPAREPALPRHRVLALQQSAGNQAVQRLIYTQASQTLRVPKSYADKKLPWDGDYMGSRAVKEDSDKTFLQIVNQKKEHLAHVAGGINVSKVAAVAAVEDAAMVEMAGQMATKKAAAGTAAALKAVVPDPDRVMIYPGPPTQYAEAGDIESHMILKAKDFFPEKPDLPDAGAKVRDQIPGAIKGQLLWNLTCVLIALIKAEGHANVKTLTSKTTSTLDEGVQALHDYYRDEGVEYDDTSSRFQVMNKWGYKPIFSGKCRWEELPLHLELKAGRYIFDITGHTVMVDVLQDIPKADAPLATTKGYFTCHSDKDNYKINEFTKDVEYIWKN